MAVSFFMFLVTGLGCYLLTYYLNKNGKSLDLAGILLLLGLIISFAIYRNAKISMDCSKKLQKFLQH